MHGLKVDDDYLLILACHVLLASRVAGEGFERR